MIMKKSYFQQISVTLSGSFTENHVNSSERRICASARASLIIIFSRTLDFSKIRTNKSFSVMILYKTKLDDNEPRLSKFCPTVTFNSLLFHLVGPDIPLSELPLKSLSIYF